MADGNGGSGWNVLLPTLTALGGLILGVLGSGVAWLAFRRDRSVLDVEAGLSLSFGPDGFKVWKLEIVLRNRGRRPCAVTYVGVEVDVSGAEVRFGDRPMKLAGPMRFDIHKEREGASIGLGESDRKVLAREPFPSMALCLMMNSGQEMGTLLVVDSLGGELRHRFRLPEREFMERHREQVEASEVALEKARELRRQKESRTEISEEGRE